MTTLNEAVEIAPSTVQSTQPAQVAEKPLKEKKAPTTGQSGPKLVLEKADLNDKEAKVVAVLSQNASPISIIAIATTCFEGEPSPKANSWVRNAMRRLARASWVEKVGSGTYTLSTEGRTKFAS